MFFSEIPNKWHSTKIQRLEVLGCTNQTDCESKGMCSIVLTALNSSFHRLAESRSVWTLRRPDGERLAPGMRFLSYLRYGLLLCLYGLFACSYSIIYTGLHVCNETTVVFFWSDRFVYEICIWSVHCCCVWKSCGLTGFSWFFPDCDTRWWCAVLCHCSKDDLWECLMGWLQWLGKITFIHNNIWNLELELACRLSWTRATPSEDGQAVLYEPWCYVLIFIDPAETSDHVPNTATRLTCIAQQLMHGACEVCKPYLFMDIYFW